MKFELATRNARVPKILISGPSGGGKTKSALRLMKGLVGDQKLLVIDTENSSATIYAKEFNFFHGNLPKAEQNTIGYQRAMNEAIVEKAVGVIVDGITPAWKDILDRSARMEGNSYTNWGKLTPLQDAFKEYIIQYPLPLICTVRSKQGYVIEINDKGKSVPKKVGMEPEQGKDIEYEFDIVLSMNSDTHFASIDKCRYTEIEKYFNDNGGSLLITEEVGKFFRQVLTSI